MHEARLPGFGRYSWAVAAALGWLAATHPANADDAVARLSWLAGCWSSDGAEPGSGEHWTPPAGDSLLGISRTVRGGRMVSHEFMRISVNSDGRLVFHAQPADKAPASFAELSLTADEVVFQNLEHEFPQRIRYRLEAPGSLRASIEGERNGAIRRIDYPLRRVSCDSLLPKERP